MQKNHKIKVEKKVIFWKMKHGEKAYKFSESSIIVTIPFDRTAFELKVKMSLKKTNK